MYHFELHLIPSSDTKLFNVRVSVKKQNAVVFVTSFATVR
jgi:hypothetical protein